MSGSVRFERLALQVATSSKLVRTTLAIADLNNTTQVYCVTLPIMTVCNTKAWECEIKITSKQGAIATLY